MSETEEEIVYISHWKTGRKKYHTDPDCGTLKKSENVNAVSLSYCEDRELCTICEDGTEAYKNAAREVSERDCPYCGKTVKKLPYHLVKCDEKGQLE